MTTTLERSSPSQESSKLSLDFIPDEQLQTEIAKKIDSLDSLYRSYLSDPNRIPDEWKEDLQGLDFDDHAEVLAGLCIKSEGYYPDFNEDENPPAETKTLYNQIRETAYERLISSEVTSPEASQETSSILERRKSSKMYGPLKSSRSYRPAKPQGSTFFENQLPQVVENSDSERTELTEAFELELETHLNEFAEAYAVKLAKESDRSLGQLFHERSDAHIREELTDMMGGIATHLMDKAEATGLPEAEYSTLIETKLNKVTDEIIEKMADARMKEYDDSSAIRKFIYSKWSKWGEQGKLGKVKKGIVMGAVSAPLAIMAAPIAGATVGIGITGALIATGSRSLGRGLVSSHINQKANAPENIDKAEAKIRGNVLEYKLENEYKKVNSFDTLSVIDTTVDKYRKLNRRRVIGGVGIAMSVGLVSSTLAEYLTDTSFGSGSANAAENSGTNRHPLSIFKNENNTFGVSDANEDNRVDLGPPIESDIAGTDAGGETNSGSDMGTGPAAQTPEHNSGKLGREGMFEGQYGTRHLSPEGKKAALEAFDGYRVKSSDSVWSLSEQLCREQGISNPTVYEIDATKDLLLDELKSTGSVNENGELIAGTRLYIH